MTTVSIWLVHSWTARQLQPSENSDRVDNVRQIEQKPERQTNLPPLAADAEMKRRERIERTKIKHLGDEAVAISGAMERKP